MDGSSPAGATRSRRSGIRTGRNSAKTQPFDDIALRAALSSERIIAGDWTGKIRVSALDGKPLGELSANPPTLADRLADTQKRLADTQAALLGLQQQLAVAEQKFAAEKAALVEKRKAEAAVLEAAKALPPQLEKRLAEETAQLGDLRKAPRCSERCRSSGSAAEGR